MKQVPAFVGAMGPPTSAFAYVYANAARHRPAADAPPCEIPEAKRLTLDVNFENNMPTEIKADFNGDSWCDHALEYLISLPPKWMDITKTN